MQLEMVRISRTDGNYTYEVDSSLPKSIVNGKVNAVWFKLSDSVVTGRNGQVASVDGMFSSTQTLKRGQLFKHLGILYRVTGIIRGLSMLAKYSFVEADVDDDIANTEDIP